jgi:hypothetical protein
MREPGRVVLGIVAASITAYVLFGFAFAAIITVGTRDMSASDGLGGATYLLVVYAALAVPIAVVTCAVVFGTTYGFLRVLRFLHGIAFPAVGAAVLLAFGISGPSRAARRVSRVSGGDERTGHRRCRQRSGVLVVRQAAAMSVADRSTARGRRR